MNIWRLFSWPVVALALVCAVITGMAANGPSLGVAYLESSVPGVTIPDVTPFYAPQELPGFFEAMGQQGRAAYLTINNLDFAFIASYSAFGFLAVGTLMRFITKNPRRASRLAWLGLVPGLNDAIESLAFRFIVTHSADNYTFLNAVAATATKAKFITMGLAMVLLLALSLMAGARWLDGKRSV